MWWIHLIRASKNLFILLVLKRIKKYTKKHKKPLAVFVIVFLFPFHHFSQNKHAQLIVWHVGQGQMVTYSDLTTCIHFDMGGEVFPLKQLIKECGRKENKVFFSHYDWDHINFTKQAWKRLPFFCRLNDPGGRGTKKKKQFLEVVPRCGAKSLKSAKKIFREITFPADRNKSKRHTSANKHSRVVTVKSQVLIPGDSPGSSERLWQNKIKARIRILVVSHHGSRYSTTPQLLARLPFVKIAVCSSRKKRYGHPHPLTRKRLAVRGIPLLSTERFNHIRIPLH